MALDLKQASDNYQRELAHALALEPAQLDQAGERWLGSMLRYQANPLRPVMIRYERLAKRLMKVDAIASGAVKRDIGGLIYHLVEAMKYRERITKTAEIEGIPVKKGIVLP